jgi:hypothetical protein
LDVSAAASSTLRGSGSAAVEDDFVPALPASDVASAGEDVKDPNARVDGVMAVDNVDMERSEAT